MVFATIIISILDNGSSLGGGLLVIIIMIFMRQSEGIIRNIFGFGNAKSLGDVVAAGALLASSMRSAGSVLGKVKSTKTPESKTNGSSSSSRSSGSSSGKRPALKDTSNTGNSSGRDTYTSANNNAGNNQTSSSQQENSNNSTQRSSSQGSDNSQTNTTNSMTPASNQTVQVPNDTDVERTQREYNTEINKANNKFKNTLGNILVGANKKAFELASGVGIGGAFSGDVPGMMTATNFTSAATGAAGAVKNKVVSGGKKLKNWATTNSRINTKTNSVIDAYDNLKNEKGWNNERMLDETERVLNIKDTSKIKDEKLREYAETVQDLRTEYEGKYQEPNDVVLDRITKIQSGDIQKDTTKRYTKAPKTRPINRTTQQSGKNNTGSTNNTNTKGNNKSGRSSRNNRRNTRKP